MISDSEATFTCSYSQQVKVSRRTFVHDKKSKIYFVINQFIILT